MEPLNDSPEFIHLLTTYGKNPIFGLLLGTIITGIMQSSGATLGLLQALAISGVFAGVGGTDAIQICIPIMIGTTLVLCHRALIQHRNIHRGQKRGLHPPFCEYFRSGMGNDSTGYY